MSRAQLDLFSTQHDLFPAEPVSYAPNPDRIRVKLNVVLDQLRKADRMPWDRKTQRYHQLVFPQMTSALPADEAAQYRLAFEQELLRFQ